jgi:hypothetical protein
MNYINFAIITDTPVTLRNFLISRNILQLVPGDPGGPSVLAGVLPGMEWVEVPNPIITDPGTGGDPFTPGYIPPTYDTRRVFLVKFAHDSVDDQLVDVINPADTIYDWSKFGRWIKNNSTVVTAPANYTINGQPAGDARKITGQPVWLVHDRPERFGVWQ